MNIFFRKWTKTISTALVLVVFLNAVSASLPGSRWGSVVQAEQQTLPACGEDQQLIQIWPTTNSGRTLYLCVTGGGDTAVAAQADVAAVFVVAASGLAATPAGWVVVGALVVGGTIYTLYQIDQGNWTWDNAQANLQAILDANPGAEVESWGDQLTMLEYLDEATSSLGEVQLLVENSFPAFTSVDGAISWDATRSITKFFVDAETLVMSQGGLWKLETATAEDLAYLAGLGILPSAITVISNVRTGATEIVALFDLEMPAWWDWGQDAPWEMGYGMIPVTALDLLTLPMTVTEEGSVVVFPKPLGAPELKPNGHTAKPGSIHWAAKVAAWNLAWTYLLRAFTTNGDPGDDWDWCGVRLDGYKKTGIAGQPPQPKYSVVLVKYDAWLWWKGIRSWIAHFGRGTDWTKTAGIVLWLNAKNPTAWWGVEPPTSGVTPRAVTTPAGNGRLYNVQKAFDSMTRIPCDLVDAIQCTIDPATCIPPGMLPQ